MMDGELLSECDVRAVVRLVADLHGCDGSLEERKRKLMGGLCALIDADLWVWAVGAQTDPAVVPAYLCLDHGGFTVETFASYVQAIGHPAMNDIQARFMAEAVARGTHLTRHRRQLDPDDSYQRTDAFRLWKGAGINGVIMSFRPLSPGVFSGLGIYRRLSAPIFTDRENRIAHITLAGVPWLHEHAPVKDHGDRLTLLSPRQRIILTCLVQGFTRRQIAEHMALSLHTVNDYVKGVFAQFGVHSQPALIARFRTGDGGDS